MTRIFLTTTIPYVNAPPHVGFALEVVQADALARYHRRQGDDVRLLTGTDDNSLKNVLAAEAAGVGVREWVDRHAEAIAALREPLNLSYDDFVRTSADPRHGPGVERLWRACLAAGDLYRGRYEGLYCVGCESYYTPDELAAGRCPEHGTEPERLAEDNWFFRLSRHAGPLRAAIDSGRLRIEPEGRRNEVLALIDGGLPDFSVSRSRARARGWGIPVPDDPDQVIYVWWDALGYYVTSLGYGTAAADLDRWWTGADRRVQLLRKGVLRFHGVYWPAILLSAGLPLPTELYVHDYLTIDGNKISKSTGGGADPAGLAARFGTDAVRWWLLRDVPRVGDVDFTVARLVERANADLAGGIGNLVSRVGSIVHRYHAGRAPAASRTGELAGPVSDAAKQVDAAVAGFDLRAACVAITAAVATANRRIEQTRPWELARAEWAGDREAGDRLDVVIDDLLAACRGIGELLAPFVPGVAAAALRQCTPVNGTLPPARPVFTRLKER
jgi:methionyl-tRNA synthetase